MSLYPAPTLPSRPYVPFNGTPIADDPVHTFAVTGFDLAIYILAAIALIAAGVVAWKLAKAGVR